MEQKVLLEEMHEKLKDAYEDFKPNEESLLEDFPYLKLKMNAIENQQPSTNEEYFAYFSVLTSFMEDWFPDSREESEQRKVRQIIDDSYKVMRELNKQIN